MSTATAPPESAADIALLTRYEAEMGTLDAQIAPPVELQESAAQDAQRDRIAECAAAVLLPPRPVRAQDLPEEAEIQRRFAKGLGAVVMGVVGERPPVEAKGERVTSILDAIDEAERGNTAWLERNIDRAAAEALISEGIMEDVTITRGPDGELEQAGQSLYDVFENSIRLHPGDHPGLQEMTRTAALDYDTINVLDEAGYFDAGYILVIPRLVPTDTPGRSIRGHGHFENQAVAWNFIWKSDPDTFTLRPMFTAGVVPLAGEESQDRAMTPAELDAMYDTRLGRRHDIKAVSGMYAARGLPVPDKVAGFQRGYIAHRSDFSDPDHPEVDTARDFDAQLGPGYFLGRERRPDDAGYLEDSRKRIEALRGLQAGKQAIIRALIEYRHTFADEMAAARCLAAFVAGAAVDYVYDNRQYWSVLGPSLGMAAYNTMRSGGGRDEVRRKARVNMCGFGGDTSVDSSKDSSTGDETDENGADSDGANGDGDCLYLSKTCPLCQDENVLTLDRKFLYGPDGRKWRIIQGYCKSRCIRIYEKG